MESAEVNGCPASKDEKEDSEYFDSYYDLDIHKLMLEDRPRTLAYQKAIYDNRDAFKDKIVMDIGAGTGILSLFCWRAGAKRVYAVEGSAMGAPGGPLESVIASNPGADKVIKIVNGISENFSDLLKSQHPDEDPNTKVDIIVSEWMGFYLLHESMLNSVIRTRKAYLADDGFVLPSHAKIYAAACEFSTLTRERSEFWTNDVYGFDFSSLKKFTDRARPSASSNGGPEVLIAKPEEMLTEIETVAEFDLLWTEEDEVSLVEKRSFASISRDADLRGLALWFDVSFAPYADGWEKDSTLSTGPEADPTHWKQVGVLLPKSEKVEKNEVIGWELTLARTAEAEGRRYAIKLEMLDPATEEHPTPCACGMAQCALVKALMDKEEEDMKAHALIE